MPKPKKGDPNCPDCYGDGVVTLESNNDPRTQRDVSCWCTEERDEDDDTTRDPVRVTPRFESRASLPLALCGVCGAPTTSDKWRNGVKLCVRCQ